HHALVAAGRAVDEEHRLLGPEARRREVLRFDQRLFRLQQIVEPANLRQVDREHVVADEVAEAALHPDPLVVAGRVKRDHAPVDVVEEDLEVRRARLIEAGRLLPNHNAREYTAPGAARRWKNRRAMVSVRSASPAARLARAAAAVLAGSALLYVSAQIAVPANPFFGVPVTLQTLALPLLVALLGRDLATLAALAYLAEGLSGLPVFQGHTGGLLRFVGPTATTAGYLLAFPLATYATG